MKTKHQKQPSVFPDNIPEAHKKELSKVVSECLEDQEITVEKFAIAYTTKIKELEPGIDQNQAQKLQKFVRQALMQPAIKIAGHSSSYGASKANGIEDRTEVTKYGYIVKNDGTPLAQSSRGTAALPPEGYESMTTLEHMIEMHNKYNKKDNSKMNYLNKALRTLGGLGLAIFNGRPAIYNTLRDFNQGERLMSDLKDQAKRGNDKLYPLGYREENNSNPPATGRDVPRHYLLRQGKTDNVR
ncbi:MAG: hypothetical protein SFT68_00975 [Rickettsiaceae bacterium]|nr:hypothetical protein [Rickettsiaceae bacterium]